jgi:hypothetical protein
MPVQVPRHRWSEMWTTHSARVTTMLFVACRSLPLDGAGIVSRARRKR